jgi:hypothetical protein
MNVPYFREHEIFYTGPIWFLSSLSGLFFSNPVFFCHVVLSRQDLSGNGYQHKNLLVVSVLWHFQMIIILLVVWNFVLLSNMFDYLIPKDNGLRQISSQFFCADIVWTNDFLDLRDIITLSILSFPSKFKRRLHPSLSLKNIPSIVSSAALFFDGVSLMIFLDYVLSKFWW